MAGPFVTLIPVNRLDRAKGRLADLLDADERARLALITTSTVIAAVRDAGGHPVVLTSDARVERAIEGRAEILRELPGLSGLNAQLESAREALAGEELLILHADLPLANSAAIHRLVSSAPPGPSATIVRSGDGGTNAMLLRPPGLFSLRYGKDSARLHRAAAHAAGVVFTTCSEPSLTVDLDTPADIATLLEHETGRVSPAGQQLIDWDVPSRLPRASA